MNRKHLIYIIEAIILMILLAGTFFYNSCERDDAIDDTPEAVKVDTLGMMITSIQQCSRLYTAEYKLHKIIVHEDETRLQGKIMGKEVSLPFSVGERKIAIPMYATIKASIDLSQLTAEDVDTLNGKIEIFLPQPEAIITETHIDHDGIKQHVALLRHNFTDKELQNYEKQGREAIEKDIRLMHIEDVARQNAARQLIPLIERMGYRRENITISFRKNEIKILRKDK